MRIETGRPTAAELDELFPTARLLTRLREADESATDGYVIADVVGDVGGSTAPVNYAPRWYAGYLGNGVRS